jgi:hypothetical protein
MPRKAPRKPPFGNDFMPPPPKPGGMKRLPKAGVKKSPAKTTRRGYR